MVVEATARYQLSKLSGKEVKCGGPKTSHQWARKIMVSSKCQKSRQMKGTVTWNKKSMTISKG